MKRIYLWDNLKFFAILCIVLLHSTIPYIEDGMPLMRYVQPFINMYPMTLFTIISGFWYKDRSFKELALLFLWPCILFTIVNDLLGYFFYPNYIHYFKFKPGYAMWYLMALFLYSMATKWIRQKMGIKGYLLFAFLIAFAIGCVPISNRYFDIQRISCLFPCYAFGVFIKEYIGNQSLAEKLSERIPNIRIKCAILLTLIILCNLVIIHCFPQIQDAFRVYYGLNLKVALEKWIMIFMRMVACTCLIVVFPDKEYWFTKYGARTINVYLLHIIPVFIICRGCLYNYRYEWWGLVACFVGVPLLCTLLFSKPVDRVMKRILFHNHMMKIKNSRTQKT